MKLKLTATLAIVVGALIYLTTNCAATPNSAQTLPKSEEPQSVASKSRKRTPVIVELFTSEGCSSCPPADQTLDLLAREQPFADAEIIALSEHVDYWNRLGWADPFSSAQFSQRQNEYSSFFKKNGDVYTPQMIVDGTREFVGSNMREAQKAITAAAKMKKADVNLTAKIDQETVALVIKIENLPDASDSAIVLLAVTEDELASNVSRGENSGQKLQHTAVARTLTSIGTVKENQQTFDLSTIFKLDKAWKNENLNAVVFVQDARSREIFGAAKISLKTTVKK